MIDMKSTEKNKDQIQNEVMRELSDNELDGASGGVGVNDYMHQSTQDW